MDRLIAVEPQNQSQLDDYTTRGGVTLGPWTSHIYRSDPRHLGFLLARYKFCAKMLSGKNRVLEVGCGDALGTPVVLQTVGSVHGLDFEAAVLRDAQERMPTEFAGRFSFSVTDISEQPMPEQFDAAYSLDVIEHVPAAQEDRFMANICASLAREAVYIMGTPNITAEQYASPGSREGHINLKSGETLNKLVRKFFHNVFLFSMNDEVIHTGYTPMSHYLIAMGVGVKG